MNDTENKNPAQNELAKEIKKDASTLERRAIMLAVVFVFVVGGGAAAAAYLAVSASRIYIEKSDIEAPQVKLTASASGVLKALYVSEGQVIPENTVVAQVGNELIKSTAGGLVISAEKDLGRNVAQGEAVVTTIDPSALKAVGRLAEDKGLKDVHVGERALFTVDAFGGKQYEGVVDEVSPTSRDSDVVFSISDKRETKEFDVKIRFDATKYPELRNGMSARIWVYKD